MELSLTEAQQQAVDASPDRPARVIDPTTRQGLALLPSADFDWVRELLSDEPDAPRGRHPRTQQSYALLPEDRYERFKAFFEEDPLSPAERQALLREAGKRAGWDDPCWDEDDELQPREKP